MNPVCASPAGSAPFQGGASTASSNHELDLVYADTDRMLESAQIGGKAANLQKLGQIGGLSIPQWLVVPAAFFHQFLEENILLSKIEQLDALCKDHSKNAAAIEALAKEIQSEIRQHSLNQTLFTKIQEAQTKLQTHAFAIRSSGSMEDSSSSSCAGLYDSFLNIQDLEGTLTAIKAVWASSFNLRVIQERARLHVPQTNCTMGVIIQAQIDPRISGVASTRVLSNHYPGIQISGNYGTGESVVSGEVSVDGWIVHPTRDYIIESIKGRKESCSIPNNGGGVKTVPVPDAQRDRFVMSSTEIMALAQQVRSIKTHYGLDIDVEFTIDHQGRLFILQARPLVDVQTNEMQVVDIQGAREARVIGRGVFSVSGVAVGRLVFVDSLEQLEKGKITLSSEDIVLAYVTTNVWSQYLGGIRGLITREGSPTSHPILLSREKGIPCVIGISGDFAKLVEQAGTTVTLDGFNKCVYAGQIPTKKATIADLAQQFEPVKVKQWPDLNSALPHLLHNKMAVKSDEKYWRRTPTYPVVGFQEELNMRRFDFVPILLGKDDIRVNAKVIDGYTCCELSPFSDYVGLFKEYNLERAAAFNRAHRVCIGDFLEKAQNCTSNQQAWEHYIESYARFRAYIWLGDALRSYAQRKVEEVGSHIELPGFYLDECSHEIQAEIEEVDSQMHRELYELAVRFQDSYSRDNRDFCQAVERIGKKFRFEHGISLDRELDLEVVFSRVEKEIEAVKGGKVFSTSKGKASERVLLPEIEDLKGWLRVAIENRILQSDAHHIDARAKELVRPQLLAIGTDIFRRSVAEVGRLIAEQNDA